MDDHIESNLWDAIDTKFFGSEAYQTHIGVMRVMFKIDNDPEIIVTLNGASGSEVWTKFENVWTKVY